MEMKTDTKDTKKTSTKSGVKNYLDMLFNEEGLRTDLKITVTDETMYKIIAALIGSGIVVVLFSALIKNAIKNQQLNEITERLVAIEELIKK